MLGKATELKLFACFFAWFAVAPLMPFMTLIRSGLGLSAQQIANINITAALPEPGS